MSTLKSKIEMTDIDKTIFKDFDYTFEGTSEFEIPVMPSPPKDFKLGVIVGSSGSGKSTLLKQFGNEEEVTWDNNKSIVSHFNDPIEANIKLSAVGLNSIPTWGKPRNVLSNGEGFRADLARKLKNNAVIDEYSSVINREVAKSCSVALSKYIKRHNLKNIILASCHDDILEWLQPDWVYNTDTQEMLRGSLRQPKIHVQIHRGDRRYWELFARHHYLTSKLPPVVRSFILTWDKRLIGYIASIALPSRIPPLYDGDNRKFFRECRTVILPDYQGLGLGTRFSNAVADIHIEQGLRYFSKTSHKMMGEYRQNHPELWRPTSTNLKKRYKRSSSHAERFNHMTLETVRLCYSHEYIGENRKTYNPIYNNPRKESQLELSL
jgi:GNAT superfamily N-acetyltransferase